MKSKTADEILKYVREQRTPYSINFMDFHLQVGNGVYPPIRESILLAENLRSTSYGIKENERVLDYGCGSGFQSILSASLGASVVATDINPEAVKCSQKNIEYNQLEDRIEVRQGSNFELILPNERFDVVIASLPFEDAEPYDNLEYAVYDPGFQMRKALFDNIQSHLTENGRIFYTYSMRAQKISPLENSSDQFKFNIIDQKEINGELYLLFLIQPS